MPEGRPYRRMPWTWPNCENMPGDARRVCPALVVFLAHLPSKRLNARKGKWVEEGRNEFVFGFELKLEFVEG